MDRVSGIGNGGVNPRAGWAFVYRPSARNSKGIHTHSGTFLFLLEDKSSTGVRYKHTSNRAELRAVIAALQFRDWGTDFNEGWESVVIATDSDMLP